MLRRTRRGPLKQRGPLLRVRCQPCGALELVPGLIAAAQFFEQFAAHGWQKVVAVECGFLPQAVHDLERRSRSAGGAWLASLGRRDQLLGGPKLRFSD